MSTSGYIPELLEQKSKNKNGLPKLPELTPRQQQKQDALALAELIYDIFHDSLSSATIGSENIKEKNDA